MKKKKKRRPQQEDEVVAGAPEQHADLREDSCMTVAGTVRAVASAEKVVQGVPMEEANVDELISQIPPGASLAVGDLSEFGVAEGILVLPAPGAAPPQRLRRASSKAKGSDAERIAAVREALAVSEGLRMAASAEALRKELEVLCG